VADVQATESSYRPLESYQRMRPLSLAQKLSTLMPIPLTYLEMQLWIGTMTHSNHPSISPHLREHLPVVAVHHSHYNGDNMDIIKKLWAEIREKPLWAVVILIVVMYLFG